MRIISIDSVTGKELLAKDIINESDSLLMPAGTIVKKEYARRLKDLNVEYIYVEDDLAQGVSLSSSLELQIKEQCQEKVKEILLKYTYQYNDDLEKIKGVVESIMEDIFKEPEVIFNLSSIRNRGESTYSHSLNVCALAIIVSLRLKLSKKKIQDIATGCLLHDIGFSYITSDYHNLDIETCSEKEMKEIKKHIIYGYSAIQNVKWLTAASKDIIINHHERLDGSGYPFHLRDNHIKQGSRIAAVCDEFDSRVYGNFYKKMKVHEVIDYIVSQAGYKFDYNVVKAFVDSVAAYPTGTFVITNQGDTGIVLRQNAKCPTRPVIRILQDKGGNIPNEFLEKDLTKELTLFIVDTIEDYNS